MVELKSFLTGSTIWGDFGVSSIPILGKKCEKKSELDGKLPIYPLSSHLCFKVVCLFVIFFIFYFLTFSLYLFIFLYW